MDVTALADRLAVQPKQVSEPEAAPITEEPLEDADGVYEQFPEQFHDVAHVLRAHRIMPGAKARLTDLLADADRLFAADGPSAVIDGLVAVVGGSRDTARRRLRLLLALDAMMLWRPDGRPDTPDEWWALDDGVRGVLADLDVPDLLVCRKGNKDDGS